MASVISFYLFSTFFYLSVIISENFGSALCSPSICNNRNVIRFELLVLFLSYYNTRNDNIANINTDAIF